MCPVYVREAFAQIKQLAAQGEAGETLHHHDQGLGAGQITPSLANQGTCGSLTF